MSISLSDRLKEINSNDPQVLTNCISQVIKTITTKRKLITDVYKHPGFIKRCCKLLNQPALTQDIIVLLEVMLMSRVENNNYLVKTEALEIYFESGLVKPYLNLLSFNQQRYRVMIWNFIYQLSLEEKYRQTLVNSNFMDSFISYLNCLLKNKLLFDKEDKDKPNPYQELEKPCQVLFNLFGQETTIQQHKPDDVHKVLLSIGKLMTCQHQQDVSNQLQQNFLAVFGNVVLYKQFKKESIELMCKVKKQIKENYLPYNSSFRVQSAAIKGYHNILQLVENYNDNQELEPFIKELSSDREFTIEMKSLSDKITL
ncbi:hypothetical protein CYY_000613 [Polysphondylium violaceum]|uniref:Armadillo-type fold n=1 Tax=Polysphondylium violaceum TaxID=133409 RepID=A0A8J4V8R2_9MYCE|nr:hypothetical protein CYY_000613 [Polysphondylium violaceum]